MLKVIKITFNSSTINKSMQIDISQLKTLNDNLISVDFNDQKIGKIQKKMAHENQYIFSEKSLPHRAFSVFVFDNKYNLLLQQRSDIKITFASEWTNSCCSHQIYQDNDSLKYENSENDAKKRTLFELNLDLNLYHLQLVQKILYKAKADEDWGEYELDYIYFVKLNQEKLKLNPNNKEVKDYKWLSQTELINFKNTQSKIQFTPWFKLIYKTKLFDWWKQFEQQQLQKNPEVIESFL